MNDMLMEEEDWDQETAEFESDLEELTAAQRTAVVLVALGEETAARVLRHMDAKQVELIGEAMGQIGSIRNEQIGVILARLAEDVEQLSPLAVDPSGYRLRLLNRTLGEDRAAALLSKFSAESNLSERFGALKWMGNNAIINLVRNEHPQMVALVLSSLDPTQAAAVLMELPEVRRAEVVRRIASLDQVSPAALQELGAVIEGRVRGEGLEQGARLGGVDWAAALLNRIGGDPSKLLLKEVAEFDSDLSEAILEQMFLFDDIGELGDRDIQTLLREVDSELLVVALKAADEPVRDRILANMSKRAAEMLREDMEVRGPIRVAEVQEAQRQIVSLARRLADQGAINLGSGEDYV